MFSPAFQSQDGWVDARQFASLFNLSISTAKRVLADAYVAGRDFNYGDFCYPLQVKLEKHPIISTRFKYWVSLESLQSCYEKTAVKQKLSLLSSFPLNQSFEPFCDWVTLYQVHPFESPNVNNGCIISLNSDGSEEYTVDKHFPLLGSFDSSLRLRVISVQNQTSVFLSGNVSRFGRLDNVFGLSLKQVIEKVNDIFDNVAFSGYHIPHFTVGKPYQTAVFKKVKGGYQESFILAWTGARVSRLDLAVNYSLGTERDLRVDYLTLLSGQQLPRILTTIKPGSDGHIRTVYWGAQTTRSSRENNLYVVKAYDKACEIREHLKKEIQDNSDYFNPFLKYLDYYNFLRFEIKFKRSYLSGLGFNYLGNLLENNFILKKFSKLAEGIMSPKATAVSFSDLRNISKPAYLTFLQWRLGEQLTLSRSTFNRHKSIIRECLGISITRKLSNNSLIENLHTARTIKPVPVSVPSFYDVYTYDVHHY